MKVFVATRLDAVPKGLSRYASVDGSVPGAKVTWDHHVTGEDINLDAMPSVIDDEFDGVGTTMADTDALISVLAVLFGGVSRLPRLGVLRSASWSCDHLTPAPGATANEARLGDRLHQWVSAELRKRGRGAFASLARELFQVLRDEEDLPQADDDDSGLLQTLRERGGLRVDGGLAVLLLEAGETMSPEYFYRVVPCTLALMVEPRRGGGRRYTIGLHPSVSADLGPLLADLARQEHAHGSPCLGPEPRPGNENWGGRATVFGSPWNYGSRLAPEVVEAACRAFLEDSD